MVEAATRREARERAVELLYEAEAKSVHPADVIGALPLRPDAYAVELAVGVGDHVDELDALLGRYSQRWPVNRMAATDRAVLRLGAFELAVRLDVPTGACLSEAVELGSTYGSTDDTGKFVNGVLAAVAREVRDGGRRPWLPIDVVVVDMDGVIRHWQGARLGESEAGLGLPAGVLAQIAFGQPLYDDAMTGKLTAEEWFSAIGAAAADAHGCRAEDVVALWSAADWTLDDDVVALLRRCRAAGARLALFSNASTRLEADIDTMGLADLFEVTGNSARIGLIKPDPAAFAAIADQLGDEPSRLLFVDDRPENVRGALEAGWHAVRFTGVERLEATLRRLAIAGA